MMPADGSNLFATGQFSKTKGEEAVSVESKPFARKVSFWYIFRGNHSIWSLDLYFIFYCDSLTICYVIYITHPICMLNFNITKMLRKCHFNFPEQP